MRVFQYFWGKLDTGGAETFVINMIEQPVMKSISFDFCVYEDKEYFYSDRVIKDGCNIVPLAKKESALLPVRLIKRWISLYKVLKEDQYDVFHCNCDFSLKFIELWIAKKAGIKTRICHSHNSNIDTNSVKGKISFLIHIIFRKLLVKNTTHFAACSTSSAKWLFGDDIDLNRVLVANNGIDSRYYKFDLITRKAIRSQLNVKDSLLIGNVGRFTVIKNQEFIVRLIKAAKDKGLNIKACLIGVGDEFTRIEKLIRENNLSDDIILIGATDKVRDYLMAFDCYLMPSLYEGLPVSGIEAQATGLPCLVSSTVDRSLDITGNIKFISLDAPLDEWINSIEKYSEDYRESATDKIVSHGYDINSTAKKFFDLYMGSDYEK